MKTEIKLNPNARLFLRGFQAFVFMAVGILAVWATGKFAVLTCLLVALAYVLMSRKEEVLMP